MKEGYDSEARFHLPGAFSNFFFINAFLDILENNKYMFYDNVKIASIYGSPVCVWNGGRPIVEEKFYTLNKLRYIRERINFSGVAVSFTFTNSLIKEHNLDDERGNLLLREFANKENNIICHSQLLEDYIREKYKDLYTYKSSTTKCLNDINKLNEELKKDYDLVVLDYRINNKFDLIDKIENRNKIEVLCNSICNPDCKLRKKHYEEISLVQMTSVNENNFTCPYGWSPYYEVKNKNTSYVSPDNINKYLSKGINNFKLEGRGSKSLFDLIEIFSDYLIKEEYKLEFRETMYLHRANEIE